jgi:protein SCO1/2
MKVDPVFGFKLVAASVLIGATGLALAAWPESPDTGAQSHPASEPLPSDSIYQLPVSLTDQRGQTGALLDRRGHPMLVSMFYTSCQFVCPMIVDALKSTESELTREEQERLPILMVSFDSAHDNVAVLKEKAEERQLASPHWTLARTDAASARKLAAVLGIHYRALPNGEFNHTTALILVDADGRILGRTARLGDADSAFVKLVKASLRSRPD